MGKHLFLTDKDKHDRLVSFLEDLDVSITNGANFAFGSAIMKHKLTWGGWALAIRELMFDAELIQCRIAHRNAYVWTKKSEPLSIDDLADLILNIMEDKKTHPRALKMEEQEEEESNGADLHFDEIEWAVIKFALQKVIDGKNKSYAQIAEGIIEKIDS